MNELAAEIRNNLETLAAGYDQRLRDLPGYADMPADERLEAAQNALQLVAMGLETGDQALFTEFVQAVATERVAQGFGVESVQQATTALVEIVEPMLTTVETANFLWRVLVHVNATLSKASTEKIQLAEDRFRRLAEHTRDGVTIIEGDRVVYVNDRLCEILGYSADELARMSSLDFAAPEEKERLQKIMTEARQAGQALEQLEFWAVRKDGARRYLRNHYSMSLEEGQITGRFVFTTDMTEQWQAEDTLARERNVLRTLIDSIPDFIYIKDADGRFLAANNALARLMGTESGEDLLGKSDYDFYTEELADEYRADELAIMESGEALINKDEPHTDESGKTTWILTSKIPVHDSQGELIGLVGVSRDISERRVLEEQIQESLERRTQEVQISTEVAQEIAGAPALDELYQRVVTLVKERFGYYHTQIFRHDQDLDVMVVVEGYGEAGEKMKAAGHSLPYGQGVVGTAAATGEPVLASDTSQDPNWVLHPDLPDTRGELAVPIKLRNQVLGVLDVQSDTAGALTDEDQVLLQGLAGQIASAIESTQALEQASVFRQFVDASAQGFGMATLDAQLVYINPTLCQLLGIDSPDDATGQAFVPYYPPELQQRIREEVMPAVMQAGQWTGELALVSTTGKITQTLESFFLIRDEQDEALYLADVVTDITDRKRAETLLNTRIQELDCLSDIGRKIDDAPELEAFLPWVAERTVQAFQYPDLCRVAIEFEGQLYGATEAVGMRYQMVGGLRIGGASVGKIHVAYTEERDFLDEESSLLGDITRRVSAYIENRRLFQQTQEALTEMERSQAELRQVTALQQAILDYADYAVIATTPEGTIVTFNPAAERMLGYAAGEVEGLVTPAILHDIDEVVERAQLFSEELGYTIEPGFEVFVAKARHNLPNQYEWTYIRKDGSRFPVQLAVTALRDAEDNITGFMGIAQDITERRRSELEMQETLQELERLYRTMSREGWETFQRESEVAGYLYDQVNIVPADDVWLPEIGQAMEHQAFVPPDPGDGSAAIAPLTARGQVLGALGVQDDPKNPMTPEELALVESVAEEVAQALESARLFDQTQAALAESRALYEATQTIAEVLDLEMLVERLAEVACRLTQASYSVVLTLDPETGAPQHFKPFGVDLDRYFAPTRLPQGKGLLGAILQGKTVRVNDVHQHPLAAGAPDWHFPVRSVVGVPLVYRDQVRGLMLVGDPSPDRTFGETEERILSTFAAQATIAIENQRLFEQTQTALAETEELYRASADLTAAQTYDEILEALRQHTLLGEADRSVSISLFDRPWLGDKMPEWVAPVTRWSAEPLPEISSYLLREFPLASQMLNPDAPTVVPDIAAAHVDEHTRTLYLDGFGVRATILVPLVVGGQWLGYVDGLYRQPTEFPEDQVRRLVALAAQAAVAVQSLRQLEATQAQADELAILNELSNDLSRMVDVDTLLGDVHRHLARLMDTSSFYIALYDERRDEIDFVLDYQDGKRRPGGRRRAGAGLTEYVIRTGQPLLMPENIPAHIARLEGVEQSGQVALSWLGAPMAIGARVLGVITVQSYTTPRLYGEHHRDLLTAVAGQTAIAIENTRLLEQSQTRAEELAALNELGQALTARLDVREVLDEVYRQASRLVDATNFYVSLYNPEREEFHFALMITESQIDSQLATALPVSEGLTGYMIRNRTSLLLRDNVRERQKALGISHLGEEAESWLGVPMIVGDRVLGTLAVASFTTPRHYDEHDRDLLMAIASPTAIAVENARLLEDAQARAERERMVRTITNRVRQGADRDIIMRTALRELSEMLGASKAAIRLGTQEQLLTAQNAGEYKTNAD